MTKTTHKNSYVIFMAFLIFISLVFAWQKMWGAVLGPAFLALIIYLSKHKKTTQSEKEISNNLDNDDH